MRSSAAGAELGGGIYSEQQSVRNVSKLGCDEVAGLGGDPRAGSGMQVPIASYRQWQLLIDEGHDQHVLLPGTFK